MSDTRTLPSFVPSTAAVEAAAKALAIENDRRLVWDTAPAYVRNHYATLALEMLTAAAGHLVPDALVHVAAHPDEYGVVGITETITIQSAAQRAREHVSPHGL